MTRLYLAATVVSILTVLFSGCASSEEANFTWRPSIGQGLGSDAANRRAYGIVDGEDGTLYYQAVSGQETPLYSLYSLNEATNMEEVVAPGCSGMVNVTKDAVFYRGEPAKGVFRYDRANATVTEMYSGDVENLLVAGDYLYIINSANELWQMQLASRSMLLVGSNVALYYLEYSDGFIYFAERNPDDMHCNLKKIALGKKDALTTVYSGISYPMGILGSQVLYSDNTGAHLIDVNSKKVTDICRWGTGTGLMAANGNAVFYCRTDSDGFTQLCAFDLENGKTSTLMPVHCGAIYFIDGRMYLVNPVDLGFERAILDSKNPHTEWVVESGVQAR